LRFPGFSLKNASLNLVPNNFQNKMKKFDSYTPRLLFHYQNVIRPDLLAKCNYTNIMEIPLLREIQITPYYHAGLEGQGRLAIEILSGRVTTRLKECNEYARTGIYSKIAKTKLIGGNKGTNSTWRLKSPRHHGASASDQNKLSFGFLPIKGRLMYLFLDKILTCDPTTAKVCKGEAVSTAS
jgi:hypothetical protein